MKKEGVIARQKQRERSGRDTDRARKKDRQRKKDREKIHGEKKKKGG